MQTNNRKANWKIVRRLSYGCHRTNFRSHKSDAQIERNFPGAHRFVQTTREIRSEAANFESFDNCVCPSSGLAEHEHLVESEEIPFGGCVANKRERPAACMLDICRRHHWHGAGRHKVLFDKYYQMAARRRIYFEIQYAPAIRDSNQRKDTIIVAQNLVSHRKAKSIIITSGALTAFQVRGPYDIANL